jgi:xylulokinase
VSTLIADEGAAYGAALIAGVGVKAWPSVQSAVGATMRISETIEPKPDHSAELDMRYRRFKSLYPAMKESANTEK